MAKEKTLPILPRGEGTMRWRNEKQELVVYRKYIRVNGKDVRLCVTAETPAEAMKLMRKKETSESNRLVTEEKRRVSMTLADGMREWLDKYKIGQVNNRTFDRIESTYITHIADSRLGNMQERDITSDDIQDFLNELMKHDLSGKITKEELSYSSKKKVYELLHQYFEHRYHKSPLHNPMELVNKPRKTDEEVLDDNDELIIWDDDEMEKLTKVGMMKYRIGIDGYKNGPLIVFLMWAFCRAGECLALQWKDINLETGQVTISKSYSRSRVRSGDSTEKYEYRVVPTKNKKKRDFKMCQIALDAIKYYKEIKNPKSDDEYVCDTGDGIMTMTSLKRTYDAMVKYAGLSEKKHVTIHGLRHSGISYFLRHGVPVEVVSRFAGHSSTEITTGVYYQLLESQKNQAIVDLDEYIKRKKA